MSQDLTENLSPRPFEERVLAEFATIRQEFLHLNTRLDSFAARLTALEDKVDAWLRETRPIWEGVPQRLIAIESKLDALNRQLRSLIADCFNCACASRSWKTNSRPLKRSLLATRSDRAARSE